MTVHAGNGSAPQIQSSYGQREGSLSIAALSVWTVVFCSF